MKAIVKTNYKPQFAFKSLVKLLDGKFDSISSGKSRNTNSYYIDCGNDDFSKNILIRISDHTKMMESNEDHLLVLKQNTDNLELDIVSSDNFEDAKKIIINFIEVNS